MKSLLTILLFMAAPVTVATASGLRMTVEQPHFTCEGHDSHFSHVAYVPGAAAGNSSDRGLSTASDLADDGQAPLPCCDGKIGCAQFLSTNTVIRQSTEWHG